MFRVWMYIGTALSALGLIGIVYWNGYSLCKKNEAVKKAETIIEGNKIDAKTEREVLTASESDIDKRFAKWLLND